MKNNFFTSGHTVTCVLYDLQAPHEAKVKHYNQLNIFSQISLDFQNE